ncbi:MAG: chemotaxis protein CheR [Bacteroidetes bacterium]|nr:chemotaxis protein CheR [Bacteroidota bacterium]MBU1115623.1 chemotaxis protein CheR [Bacteroidota bacterium]MBU1797605.1 chemotaxis protein CheR [Bacteroidota bacterium]
MAFTFFFRDTHTLEHAVKFMVPEVSGRSKIKVWDAGCAFGPEPYTLAILLAESMGNFAFKNLIIEASDIDEGGNFGNVIANGIFSNEELGRIPDEIMAKYFSKIDVEEGFYKIVDRIRDRVKYQTHNLLSLKPIGNSYSLVICKNVLLHFKYEERIEVIKMFHQSLMQGGFLAMEQTQKMPEEIKHLFEQVVSDAQLYRKVG